MFGRLHKLLLTTTALVPLGIVPALANPLGAQVVGGSASVQGQSTASVTVTQSTDKAIINWNTFNIGATEKTQFIQPSSSSIALNRVTGGLGPSQIFGSLSANGRVFVVNPDGILVGPGANIDTAGFLATTHDIANADFMAGRYNFSIPGNPNASVVNQGTITAASGGFAALVAPGVRNTGTITARLGTVALASGNGFTLDFYGDKLITLGVSDSIAASVKDVSTGQSLGSLVSNEGKLKANGGTIELTAVAARQIVNSVINNTGVIEANTIGTHNGMIVLGAATAKSKPAGAPTQAVSVSGILSAAGKRKGRSGGTVQVTGESIELASATIDASGRSGGGTVLIGGDIGGGNPNPVTASIPQAQLQPYAVPTASTVTVDAATTIDVSAKDTGDGGKAVVWSDGGTAFNGTILARGGASSGNGGFVETSGHQQLAFNGIVNLAAPNGKRGTLLLDPQDVTIGSTGASIVTVSALVNALLSGNVLVTTGSGSGNGDITVAENVNWSNGSTLILSAYRNIVINNGVTISNTGSGTLDLGAGMSAPTNARWFGVGTGTVIFNGSGKIDFSHSTGNVSFGYNPPGGYTSPTDYSSFVSTNPAVLGQFTALMWVNNVNDLQNVNQNLAGNYILANNIDASATAGWNGGAGFIPIGNSTTPFTGIFSGVGGTIPFIALGATIDNLTINSSANEVGLFGNLGATAAVTNIGLTNASITATGGSHVGAIVGTNNGVLARTFASGTVLAIPNLSTPCCQGISEGILVGSNNGSIFQSYAIGSVGISATGGSYPAGYESIGGFVGVNGAPGYISESYAVPSIGVASGSTGQFAGWNNGTLNYAYARAGSYPLSGINFGTISVSSSLLSDVALKAALPTGFNTGVWGLSASVNAGYPYLLWQVAGSLPSSLQGTANSTGGQTTMPPGTVPFPNLQIVTLTQTNYSSAVDSTPLPTIPVNYGVPNYGVVNAPVAVNVPAYTGSIAPAPQTISITLDQKAFYIQSGTGAQLTADQVLSGSFSPGTYFIESGTGRRILAASLHPTAKVVSSTSSSSSSSGPQVDSTSKPSQTPFVSNAVIATIPTSASSQVVAPTTSTSTGPTSLVITADGKTEISNTSQWTGATSSLSAYGLLKDVQPFVAFSKTATAGVDVANNWDQYASKMGMSQSDVAYFKEKGFDAGIYKQDGKIVLAFAATNDHLNDWVYTNLPNIIDNLSRNIFGGAPSSGQQVQYLIASALAEAVRSANPGTPIVLTGWSLGGGLAAYVGATQKIPTVTFNPEGISFLTKESYDPSKVINFQIANDVAGFSGSLVGTTVVFDKKLISNQGTLSLHDIDNFIDLAYSSFSQKLTFTGSSSGDQVGPISHTGQMFFVSQK